MYMKQLVGSCHIAQALNWVLSDELEGGAGGWGRRDTQEGGKYVYI